MNQRIEYDTLGEVKVPANKYWGAQTQRALNNFPIHGNRIPDEIINGLAITKKAAAFANAQLGILSIEKRDLIATCCDEILAGKLTEHFPLSVWQTGAGTQTNMNVNEVIAHRAEELRNGTLTTGKTFLSPNDDVNKSQSTNDVFPTAIRIASTQYILTQTIPAIEHFIETLRQKEEEFRDIVTIGRTHLMDATPITLGNEFSAFKTQVSNGLRVIRNSLVHLMELPIGGTAVGTGLNAPEGYDRLAVHYINQLTGFEFRPCPNKFEAISSHDAMVETSSALKQLAVSLIKIADDLRLLASGPRCGIGEILLPANEPGSSIMPGKINPLQCEALTMVGCQIIGNDLTITNGAAQGHLQLNVFVPLLGVNLIQSLHLLTDVLNSFNEHCLKGIRANTERINQYVENSFMLATALNTHIGYEKASQIVKYAHAHDMSLKEAATTLQLISPEDFDRWVNPKDMVSPYEIKK